jgi:hypothetical protein
MTDTNIKVREHYSATGLTDRIKAALTTITPESQALTVPPLAPDAGYNAVFWRAMTPKWRSTGSRLSWVPSRRADQTSGWSWARTSRP